MIILRVKISPQAVISVQNSIPKLITSLILVTFSYAIAGLIIDLTYLIQSIVLALLYSSQGKGLADNLLPPGFLQLPISTSFTDISNYNFGTVFFLTTKNISLSVLLIIGGVLGGIIGALLGPVILPVAALGGAAIGATLFALIIVIIIFFTLISFLFGLIKCYVTIILKIILAPLEIGLGALPNSKMNFSSWLTDLVANISVFPISLIFLVLVNVICEAIRGSAIWSPSVISIGNGNRIMPFIFAMGSLLLIKKLPELIPQVIFQLKPSPFGQAIGQSLEGPTKLIKATGQQYAHDQFVKRYNSQPNPDPRAQFGKFAGNIFEILGWAKKS
jgi:hypothetical protein